MLPFLEEIRDENFDCITFLPGKNHGEMKLEGGSYYEKGDEIRSNLGCVYHITIFKQKDDMTSDFDCFEATLIDPLVYLSHIIKSGFFGVISKKTTTSEEFNQDMVNNMKESFA